MRIRYEIFRRSYLDLLACKVIAPLGQINEMDEDLLDYSSDHTSLGGGDFATQPSEALPTWDAMQDVMGLNSRAMESSVPYRLWKLAEKCAVC